MSSMELRLAGYFPKRIVPRPSFLDGAPSVIDIDPETRLGYRSLGFDVIGKTDLRIGFGHSPLSCNSIAAEYPVNAHCLLDDLAVAVAAAEQFSIEQPEPGAYHVADVLVRP